MAKKFYLTTIPYSKNYRLYSGRMYNKYSRDLKGGSNERVMEGLLKYFSPKRNTELFIDKEVPNQLLRALKLNFLLSPKIKIKIQSFD